MNPPKLVWVNTRLLFPIDVYDPINMEVENGTSTILQLLSCHQTRSPCAQCFVFPVCTYQEIQALREVLRNPRISLRRCFPLASDVRSASRKNTRIQEKHSVPESPHRRQSH